MLTEKDLEEIARVKKNVEACMDNENCKNCSYKQSTSSSESCKSKLLADCFNVMRKYQISYDKLLSQNKRLHKRVMEDLGI